MKSIRIVVLLLLVGLLAGCQNTVTKETQTTTSVDQTSEPAKEEAPFEIPNEMKVYEYDAENILGLCATYVMPGFFACKFTVNQEFFQTIDLEIYQTYGCAEDTDVITPYPGEYVIVNDFLYIIVRNDDEKELPGIYMRSDTDIDFSIENPIEPQIKMVYIEDRGDLDFYLVQVTQKYESKLEKWNEKEELDEPIKITVVPD